MKDTNELKFNIKLIRHIADVYKLNLQRTDEKYLVSQLSKTKRFLASFVDLRKRTQEILPTYHVCGVKNVYREDIAEPSMSASDVFLNAKNIEDKCFTVPGLFREVSENE